MKSLMMCRYSNEKKKEKKITTFRIRTGELLLFILGGKEREKERERALGICITVRS
jgi:hypothetical protein